MKRRGIVLVAFLIVALVLCIGCGGTKAEDGQPTNTSTPDIKPGAKTITDEQTLVKLERMKPLLEAVALAAYDNNGQYAPDEGAFFWTAAYQYINSYGAYSALAYLEDGYWRISTFSMQELAQAINLNFMYVPVYDADMEDIITYDEDAEDYLLQPSDGEPLVQCTMAASFVENAKGFTEATVYIKSGGDDLARVTFLLLEYPGLEEFEHPEFYYSISSIIYDAAGGQ
ncbi:hypothetical protein LJC20_02860 [Eubacteriales bacterium OttesenSCG-928-M02]|nr:hypothetical protein [Eubacteriales bacterium OttesenSCG-928-M02]